jgi:hypothetical protein
MKKIALLIFVLLFIHVAANSQSPCLPEGITFETQEQIDSFQVNYSNCTVIEGSVHIGGNNISNLLGLQVLTSVGGDLSLYGTTILTSLAGLDNLVHVGGELTITYNEALSCLSGLNTLISVGSNLHILQNDALKDFSGLNNLLSVGGYFDIIGNDSLESLTGLEAVTSLNHLSFQHNPSLTSLMALENLDSVAGVLRIGNNDALASLEGLHHVTCVGDNFLVYENDALIDFTGLDNLVSVGNWFGIWDNDSLISLNGLEALSAIGGDLTIGYWHQYPYSPYGNASLTSLEALQNLVSIGGLLRIEDNDLLGSLSGVDNIGAGSIANLYIHHNDTLAECDVAGICAYLVSPGGTVEIYANEMGCDSPDEVQAACLTTVEEIKTGNGITIIPNPSNDKVTISSHAISGNTQLLIFNVGGEKVLERKLTDPETQLDISALPRGVYFVRVQDEERIEVMKLIKQ